MKATVPYIEKKFEEFNRQIFGGKLPKIPVELSDAKTFLGQCVYKKRRKPFGKAELYDFRLRINARVDLPEREVEDTIIHEMIHYYIGYNKLEDASAHGPLFLGIMNEINRKFGRNLTVSHKSTQEQREQLQDKRSRYHVIAVVSFRDGRTGIKVLPRVVRSILYYYNNVLANREIASIQLYMSNNIFFNRYPNSSALKVHFLEADEIGRQLEGAEKMACDGKTIKRNQTP
ncbi:MAG: SprT-like domain-containing protein [Prevotella sp.]|nr:SprT-like domain-containing protein [Prevotella sp.]